MCALAACADKPHGFHFEASFAPSEATILVDGMSGISGIEEDFDTYRDAQTHGHVAITVMYAGSAADVDVWPGYCDRALSAPEDLGEHYSERVNLMPATRLALDLGCFWCEGSKGMAGSCP